MKVLLAVSLNTALLALLVPWLRHEWRSVGPGGWRVALALGLGARLGAGAAHNWTLVNDAAFMQRLSHHITKLLLVDPAQAWQTLVRSVVVVRINTPAGSYDAVYQGLNNTWFIVKILSFLNLASLETGWVNGVYLSLFSFVGCWQLARALGRTLPGTPAGAGAVAFLLWPSVWFWASGLSKEALLLGSGAWLTALVVSRWYGTPGDVHSARNRPPVFIWLGVSVLVYVHFRARYFFAAPLLGVLAGVGATRLLHRFGLARRRWQGAAVLLGVLAVGVWAAPSVSVGFSVNKFTNQVVRSYSGEVAQMAQQPHLEYPDLRPTLESILQHAPLAMVNTITRPWLGEVKNLRYSAVAAENTALVGLMVLALLAVMRGKAGQFPFVLGLGLGIFCLVLAALIGLTTPNLGALHRYRSALLPFLLLLLLQNGYAVALLRRLNRRATAAPPPPRGAEALAPRKLPTGRRP